MSHDFRVRELGRTVLVLRHDLRVTPQVYSGEHVFVLEDPVNSKFYRLGAAEYAFVSLLNGETNIGDALQATATRFPAESLGWQEAASICKWLIECNLASTPESKASSRVMKAAREAGRREFWQKMNPMSLRVPLLWPDRWFRRIAPYCGWVFSWPVFTLWLILLAVAGYFLHQNADRLVEASQGVFDDGAWRWLLLVWVALKLIHEFAHGVACRKAGGVVREAGVMLILFTPVAYVDVTTSWRFRSKWKRILVAAAGMYAELAVAAVAAIVWAHTGPGALNHICFQAALMASATTILFNANPLMRFDGYYILSDLLEIPNLYGLGQQSVNYYTRRFILGLSASLPRANPLNKILVQIYGFGALVWRVLVCIGLLIAASALFEGAGVVLAWFAAALWVGLPVVRFVMYALQGKPGERPQWLRATAVCGGLVAAGAMFFLFVPWLGATTAPAIVEYEPLSVVRAESDAFIREVRVTGGQRVQPGDILLVLENRELQAEVAELALRIRETEIRIRLHQQRSELATQQAETAVLEMLKKQHAEKSEIAGRLTVRATAAGVVIGRRLAMREGSFVEKGAEILSIGDESRKRLRASVDQNDLQLFSSRTGGDVYVDVPGHYTLTRTLTRVPPQASTQPPHEALCTTAGGEIPVKQTGSESESSVEFFEPRFTAFVDLTPTQARTMHAGQTGRISFRPFTRATGAELWHQADQWFRRRIEQQSGE